MTTTHSRTLRTATAILGTASLVALLSLGAAPAFAADAPWSPPVELGDAYGDANATVVAPDGTITVVSESATGIVAISSTDAGLTWSGPVSVSGLSADAFRPAVGVTSSGLLAAAWVEESAGVRSIVVATSADRGATWSAPDSLPTVDTYVDDPVVGSAGATGFVVVWNEGFTKLSTATEDGGATWAPTQIVTQNMNSYNRASIAATGADELVVVFQEFDGMAARYSIQSRVSTDGGATWGPKALVGDDWSGAFGNGDHDAVTLADGTVVAVWNHGTDDGDALFGATSTDGGATWSPQLAVGAPAGWLRYFAIEAISPSAAGIVWHAEGADGSTLRYATVTLGASTEPVVIANSPTYGFDRLPGFAVAGDVRVAAWLDYSDSEAASGYRASVSCDSGATWSAPAVIAVGEDVAQNDAKTVVSGSAFVALWGEYSEGPSGQSLFASAARDVCGAVTPSGPALAATGAPLAPVAAIALAVLALGGALLVLRRRVA